MFCVKEILQCGLLKYGGDFKNNDNIAYDSKEKKMEIIFNKKDHLLRISLGRKAPNYSSVYLVTITREYYENMAIVYAKMVKGLFRK